MAGKSIIIIGTGIAGLSAGCYGRMNDYRTQIFEMDNARSGGLCTTWKRKDYKIDACIECWTGAGPGRRSFAIFHYSRHFFISTGENRSWNFHITKRENLTVMLNDR